MPIDYLLLFWITICMAKRIECFMWNFLLEGMVEEKEKTRLVGNLCHTGRKKRDYVLEFGLEK